MRLTGQCNIRVDLRQFEILRQMRFHYGTTMTNVVLRWAIADGLLRYLKMDPVSRVFMPGPIPEPTDASTQRVLREIRDTEGFLAFRGYQSPEQLMAARGTQEA